MPSKKYDNLMLGDQPNPSVYCSGGWNRSHLSRFEPESEKKTRDKISLQMSLGRGDFGI